ncbi:uncharacterized protein LOC126899602 isoform X2 [Daktulosphaira vitifoliae]|uniref:uncharacterized protein LOC126899602 isoform X2 n=1 Tax=Daktulosphaira vitifoliae TaxID=58002 RepID=UPI0021AA17FA|nr:uncharacterized protein LOC126899602 isoform X2 [Daktulosphaira vitifoliae]
MRTSRLSSKILLFSGCTPELSSLKPRGSKMLLQRRSTYDSITTVEPIKISEKKSIIQQPEVKDPIKSVDQKSDSRELMKVNIHEEKLEKKPQLLQQTQKTENINSQLIKDTFGLLSEQLNCNKKNSEKPNIPNNIFKENTFLLSPLKPSNSEITIQSSKSPTNELIKDTFGLLSEQLKNDKINVPEKINTNNSLKDLNRLLSTIDLCEFKPQQQNSIHAFTKNTRLNKKNKKSLLKISGRTAKKHNKAVYKERNNNGMLKKIFNMDKLDSTTTKLITATFKPLSEQSKLITLNSPKAADSTGCLKDLAKFLSSVEKHGNRTKTKLENYFNTPQIMKSKKINTFKTSKTSLNKLNYNDENTKKLDKSTSETTAKVLKETFAPFHMSLGLGPDPNENQESSSHVKCLSDGIDRTPFVDRQSAILVAKKSNRPIWKTCLNNDRNWKNKRKKFIDNTITEKSFNDLAEKIQSKPINIIKKQQHSRLKSTSSMDDLLFIPPKTAKKFYYSAKIEESYQPNPNPVIKVPIRSSQAKQTPLPYWMEQVNMDELEKSLTKKPKWKNLWKKIKKYGWFLDSIKSKNMFFPFKFGNVTVLKTKKSNPKNLDNDTKNYKKKVYKEKEKSHSTNNSNKEDNRFWTTDVYKRKPREIHKSKGKLRGSNISKPLMKLKKPKFIVAKPSLTIRKRKKSQIKPLSMVMETISYNQEKNIRQMYPPLKTYRKNGDKISEEKKPKTVKSTENSIITQKVKEIKPTEVIILNHAANDEDNQNNCDKNDWSILPEDMENEWKEFQKTKCQSDLNKVHSCVNEFYKEVEEYPIPKKLEHDKKNNIISLNESHITEDYKHAQKVWDHFECTTLGQYSDWYLKLDVLLLCDVLESFRDICLKTYGLDPNYYYTAPGMSFDCMLKHTKIELELLNDYDMLMIRAGY